MPKEPKNHKTIVISDVHLGLKWSKTKEVMAFLKTNSCETLILCGDIIDGWAILRGKKEKWQRLHTQFFELILKIAEQTKVYYLRGNHDDFLNRLAPLSYLNISIIEDLIYESNGRKYYIFHGDRFDHVTTGHQWLAKWGDIAYSWLLSINHTYNQYRNKQGKPYRSISAKIKQRVKTSVSQHNDFDNRIIDLATKHQCNGVISGHTHQATIRKINNILYMNSGDWVESLTALTEDFTGQWQLVHYPH